MARRISEAQVRHAAFAVLAIVIAEVVGTVGFHLIEGANWINAFYFESMLATGQGPPFPLETNAGKIFASIMGFVSVGSVLSAVVLAIGPFMMRVWHEGAVVLERDARRLEADAVASFRTLEEDLGGHRPGPPPPGPGSP